MSKANRNRRVRDRAIARKKRLLFSFYATTKRMMVLRGREIEVFSRELGITGLPAFPPDGFPEDSAIAPTGNVFHDYGTISRET